MSNNEQNQTQFNIMEAIIDVSSGRPDILMSIHNIHSRLYEKYKTEMNDPSKKDYIIRGLKKAFREIEKEFDNIYRVFRSNNEYIIWSLKSRDEILQSLDTFQTYEDYLRNGIQSKNSVFQNENIEYRRVFPNIETDLELPKEKTVLEKITDMVNAGDLTFISDPTTVDGNLTPIHYLIKTNRINFLRRINQLSNITFSVRTMQGQTCVDLAMETGNCEMVEFVLTNNYEKQIRYLNNQNDSLKTTQATLYEDIRKLRSDHKSLKAEYDSTRLNKMINKMKTYFIIFMILYMYLF